MRLTDEEMNAKYERSIAVVQTRLTGTYKRKFWDDLKKTGDSEAKRLLEILKKHYDSCPDQPPVNKTQNRY